MNKTTAKEILVRKFDLRLFQVYGCEAKILKDVLGLMLQKLDVDNILSIIVFYFMNLNSYKALTCTTKRKEEMNIQFCTICVIIQPSFYRNKETRIM